MSTSHRDLSNVKRAKYKYNTAGKTPTEINQELRKRGVKGFVVNVNHNRVTMLVDRRDVKRNKECMRCLKSTETRK
ncbi:hypothetical protein DLS51_08770 [Staphylococcus pseudintermedius]|uniref:hypothetical protein n=1 Tax=Staphylococcus pseudintermedius TaxID=283734 RepID=UPI00101FDB1B|nr:hypothetical protein [Staphylococcus pseudintermedius]EGQ1732834.1 hypothetical protein [Staphylococcus pseudintermedius]EGQ1780490.1 hypothetical protein [Staphylococcus pseudintermedius]EHT8045110.1 hypothetical protein [Staphylococcus pseudintermedius]MDA3091408.1 hypothetical protein [Staphylococcus pseudintermedius]MDF0005777.1 hypothetical protein [Staphylococcus pseudintermedius]